MERDERLENLSDKVRKGCALGLKETLEVIDYQEAKKRASYEKVLGKPGIFRRLLSRFKQRNQEGLPE